MDIEHSIDKLANHLRRSNFNDVLIDLINGGLLTRRARDQVIEKHNWDVQEFEDYHRKYFEEVYQYDRR